MAASWPAGARPAARSISALMSLVALGFIASSASPAPIGHLEHSEQQGRLPREAAGLGLGELERVKRRLAGAAKPGQAGRTPEFGGPIGNVSAVAGRDVRLVCTVENLGQHQVAWLKEETKTILSIDTNIIITNYRIFLIPDDEGRKWVLHIKDVQESDRGSYQCQINTNPKRSISGFLDVVVPPSLIESESTQVVEVMEHANVSLQCKASGHPRPTIGWRREDGEPIKLAGGSFADEQLPDARPQNHKDGSAGTDQQLSPANPNQRQLAASDQQVITHLNDIRSDRLLLTNIDRSMAGLYICTASNGIPSAASRQIPLYVKFVPKVVIPVKTIWVNLGEQLDIDCMIEAFPKPTSYWSERQFIDPQPLPVSEAWSVNFDQQPFGPPPPSWRQGRKLLMNARPATESTGFFSWAELDTVQSSDNDRPITGSQQKRRQIDNDGPNEWPDASVVEYRSKDQAGAIRPNMVSLENSTNAGGIRRAQKLDHLNNKAYVTVKQTALNAYTYKLKIQIAKMRLSDFGEYVCTSSNTLGTSSARVLVKKRSKHTPAAAAVESTVVKPSETLEPADNQLGYQRDGMGRQTVPVQDMWSSNHFIQVQKSDHHGQGEVRVTGSSPTPRHSNRVYDENYLQSIRSRLSPNYMTSSSVLGTERNSARSMFHGLSRNGSVWLSAWLNLMLLMLRIVQV